MRLHVKISLLLCSLINFLNGSVVLVQKPRIVEKENTTSLERKVKLYSRITSQYFVSPESDSGDESNGTGSVVSSPADSPKPQLLPTDNALDSLTRRESFDQISSNRSWLPPSTGSMDELGSPLKTPTSNFNRSLTDHETTPPTDDHGTTPPGKKQISAVMTELLRRMKNHPTTPPEAK